MNSDNRDITTPSVIAAKLVTTHAYLSGVSLDVMTGVVISKIWDLAQSRPREDITRRTMIERYRDLHHVVPIVIPRAGGVAHDMPVLPNPPEDV